MKKIILIGPPSSGKTSIRMYFFEDIPSSEILKPPSLEPTMGVNWFNYELYESEIGVVDTSGQEITSIITEDEGYLFIGADAVIFMFDITQFLESKLLQSEFLEYFIEAVSRREILDESYDIHIFVHKIDLIDSDLLVDIREDIEKLILNELNEKFGDDQRIKIHFTSINPILVDETYDILKNMVISS